MEIYAWVIMPSHVHMIVGTHGDLLDKLFADMKRHTSRELHKAIHYVDYNPVKGLMVNGES